MAFCANCGKEMSDLATTCPQCGHPAGGPARPATQTAGAYAEWWQRAVGAIIDGIIVSIPARIIMGIMGIGFGANAEFDPTTGQLENAGFLGAFFGSVIVFFVIAVLYRVILEGGPKGQTLGKMAMKIQVRDANNGGPIGYGRAFVRLLVANVLWWLFYIPGIIDVLMPLWDAKKQTIHDKAAASVVVVAPQ